MNLEDFIPVSRPWCSEPNPAAVAALSSLRPANTGELAEWVAIAMTGFLDAEGRVLPCRFSLDYVDHLSLCWQFARMLEASGLVARA